MPSFLLNPGFALAGTLLVAVPIIIHLLNRRQFRTVTWAAMDFLLQAVRRNRRRMRFESWLLLAVRCLVIGLAGLALARPMGCTSSALARAAGREAGLHVIILDDSGSMAYRRDRGDAETHLEAAKSLAANLLERLDGGAEQVVVLRASAPASDLIGAPSFDMAAAAGAVAGITQTSRNTDLPGAFDKALQIAAEAPPQQPKRLYVLTDNTTAALAGPGIAAQELRDLAADVADYYSIQWHDLAAPGQSNLAVTAIAPADALIRQGFATSFQARLQRFGGVEADVPLLWRIDGNQAGTTQSVSLGSEPEAVLNGDVELQDALTDGQPHAIAAEITGSPDGLSADDVRRVVVAQVRSMPVLIVEGRRSGGSFGGSAAFLSVALSPDEEQGYIDIDVISDLELPGRTFDDYRAVVLAGVGNISEPVAETLRRFVEGGGTLVTWLGEAVTPDNYNRVMAPRGLLPGALVQRVATGNEGGIAFDFDPQSPHPYLAAFRNTERSGLEARAILQYWRIDPDPAIAASAVLRYVPLESGRDGDLAVVTHGLGQGRVTTITTAAGDPEWTLLPLRENYPAFVHELLVHSVGDAGGGDGWMTLEAGQALMIPPSAAAADADPVLANPAGEPIDLQRRVRPDGTAAWQSPPLEQVGLYTLTGASAGESRIAVNFPVAESDIRPMNATAVRAALGDLDVMFLGDELPAAGALAETDRPDFGWSVLLVVLGLAGFEAFLAMRFGHSARQ